MDRPTSNRLARSGAIALVALFLVAGLGGGEDHGGSGGRGHDGGDD
jgi:hypothetical protein